MPLYEREQMIYGAKHFHEPAEFQGVTTLTGGKRVGVKAVTAAYTVKDTDGVEYLLVTTGATDMTMTLPTAKDNKGRVITIRKVDTGAGKITVDGEGAETIDGNTTAGIWYQNNFITMLCDGSAWYIVGAPGIIKCQACPASWPIGPTTNAVASPATWDIAAFVPLGTKAVYAYMNHYISSASEIVGLEGYLWANGHTLDANPYLDPYALQLRVPTTAATTALYKSIGVYGLVQLVAGDRTLKMGIATTGSGVTLYAKIDGYSMMG